jgi:prevent-host-death family protein
MQSIEVEIAQSKLKQLLEKVEQGDEVVLTDHDVPVAKIVSLKSEAVTPHFGSAKGLIKLTDDFDAPLEDFKEYMA